MGIKSKPMLGGSHFCGDWLFQVFLTKTKNQCDEKLRDETLT